MRRIARESESPTWQHDACDPNPQERNHNMARTPLFTTLANTRKKAFSGRCCGFKELFLIFAIVLYSLALLIIPKRLARAQSGNAWNEVGKPRVIVQPEFELAADCSARRGGPVLVIETLTSDEWTDLTAEDFESRYIRSSKPVVIRDALTGSDASRADGGSPGGGMGGWVWARKLISSTRICVHPS